MVYYRCKCGKRESWSSMGPTRCAKCEDCGSNLASGPNSHQDPEPHTFDMATSVETDEGKKTLSLCRHCFKSKAQIERYGG